MKELIHILHLEDDQNDIELVKTILEEAELTCRLNPVQTRDEFEKALQQDEYDIILADLRLPTYDGMSALRLARELCPDVPFVFVSGTIGEEAAIEGLKHGATDYVLKQNMLRLGPAIKRALREAENRRERKQAEEALGESEKLLRATIESTADGILVVDEKGLVTHTNKRFAIMWQLPDELIRTREDKKLLDFVSNQLIEPEAFLSKVQTLYKTSDEAFDVLCFRDGRVFERFSCPLIRNKQIAGRVWSFRDITEQKRAEHERLVNLNIFKSMDSINRAIQGADDLEKMMKNLLDVVLSIFNCDRAFLLYPCDPESPTWTIPMRRNKPKYPGVWDLKTEIPMDPQVAEALRILLATDGPVAFGPDTPHALTENVSKQFNIKCLLSMAIYPKTGSPWQFGIHQCAYARDWTAEEMRLFEAIGRRLADSLSILLSYRDLRKSEEFLDKIIENIPDMIFVKDSEKLRFVRLNKAGEQLLGYSQEEMLGKNDYDFFPKEKADFFTAKDREVLSTKKLVNITEETIINKSNDERILHTKKIPIMDETGVPQYLLGISEDITEQKQVEEFVRKLSLAVEQSPVSIVITDFSGNIEFVNRKFTQITGYTYDEALGKNPRILKSGETSAEEYRRLWKTIISGGVWRGEFHNRKKSGELYWESASISPILDPDGSITHFVAVKEDITERKRLEAQFIQAQKMESVGRLAGGVAHDFNNMLGVIGGYTELALDRMDPTHPLFADLQEIQKASIRSADLTRQLLAFARKQAVTPKVLELNKTIGGMLKMLRRLIGEDIKLVWKPGKGVWPVRVDPSQIDQILANLCVNARDAMPGVGKLIIETDNKIFDEEYYADHPAFIPGEYALLAVSDKGHGIDKKTMERIFEPFFTTKEMGKGTGLGLSTVYGIVKQNNGFINVYSEPGHGTIFKIYLPRHVTISEQLNKKSPEILDVQGHETILLVEDDSTILEIGKRILERFGYRVLATGMPSEAIRVAGEYADEIHLLITDVIMPEMNGQELVNKLTSLYPGLRYMFMSGYSGDVIAQHGALEEGTSYIQKPFSMQALCSKVRKVLDAKKEQK